MEFGTHMKLGQIKLVYMKHIATYGEISHTFPVHSSEEQEASLPFH